MTGAVHGNRTESRAAFPAAFDENQASRKGVTCQIETQAIERALDFVIAEHGKNCLVLEAHERFLCSGIHIKDVYGALFGKSLWHKMPNSKNGVKSIGLLCQQTAQRY